MAKVKEFVGFINQNNANLFESLTFDNKEEISFLLERAEGFIKGEYVFQNDWDMEKTNKIEYLELDNIDWNYNPDGDPEWTYMLNRHAFLLDVAVAYELTKEEKCKEYIKTFILSFIENASLIEDNKSTSWRTIDTSLRVINWLRVFEFFSLENFTRDEQRKIQTSIEQHLSYLIGELKVERGQSNWQIIEICGVVSAALYLDSREVIQKVLPLLKVSLELQIEGDGLQREQSFMYHHEVLICLLMICRLLINNEENVPSWLTDYGVLMSEASVGIMDTLGNQVAYGDSDIESMIGVLEAAEVIFKQPFLPSIFVTGKTSLFSKLLVGTECFKSAERKKYLNSKHFKNSGISLLRNQKNTDFTLFKCGPLGGGHGHDDLLHLEIEVNHVPVLVDSGRYSYEVDNHDRLEFKKASAHNTITINEANFNHHSDAWDSLKVSTPLNQKFESGNTHHFVEGGHLGYFDKGVLVNRKVIYIDSGIWFISDEIFTNSSVTVESHFHFATANLKGNSSKYLYENQNVRVSLEAIDGDGEFIKEDCLISPEYNRVYSSEKLKYRRQISKNHVQTYVLINEDCKKKINSIPVYSEGEKMPKEIVEGFELVDETDEVAYVIMQHQEPNNGRRAYQIKDQYIYGKVIYIELDQQNNSYSRVVLD